MSILAIEQTGKITKRLQTAGHYNIELVTVGAQIINRVINSNYNLIISQPQIGEYRLEKLLPTIENYYQGDIIIVGNEQERELFAQFKSVIYISLDCEVSWITTITDYVISESSELMQVAEYQIDYRQAIVYHLGQRLRLSVYGQRILIHLLENQNQLVTYQQIFNVMPDQLAIHSNEFIDSNINLIRKATNDNRIRLISGQGYVFFSPKRVGNIKY